MLVGHLVLAGFDEVVLLLLRPGPSSSSGRHTSLVVHRGVSSLDVTGGRRLIGLRSRGSVGRHCG